MTLPEFLAYVKTRRALNTAEIHQFMNDMSNEARRITFELNNAYHTPDEVRALLSRLFGKEVDSSFRVFPPFYTDFGKNITVGKDVFINACCHFQDHGGVVLGDGCQIGHNVVFATLNHGLAPEDRQTTYPAPIVLGKKCVGGFQLYHSARSNHRRQCSGRSWCGSHERCARKYNCRRGSGKDHPPHLT